MEEIIYKVKISFFRLNLHDYNNLSKGIYGTKFFTKKLIGKWEEEKGFELVTSALLSMVHSRLMYSLETDDVELIIH
jgi:hypothetical protein